MRLEQLTFSRFLAAISIVIYHYGLHFFPFNSLPLAGLLQSANLGVSYFFILSGFVMIIAYGRRGELDAVDFWKQRFARIYPVYFLSLSLCLLFNINSDIRGYSSVLLNVFAIQAWYPGKVLTFNFPAWSISVEFFFYAIFPFLLNSVYSRRKLRTYLIPIAILFILTQVITQFLNVQPSYHLQQGKMDFLFYFPLLHLSQFLVGNLAGLFFIHKFKRRRNYDFLIVLVVLCTVFLLISRTSLLLSNGLMAFVFVPLILLLSANTGWITKVFKQRPLVYLGDISFTVYILQVSVHQWFELVGKRLQLSPGTEFFAYLFTLLVVSALCYSFFEMPARKLIKEFKLIRAPVIS
jgi:peptidoglycan/LPS O-acetylase OafA/YrhL